MRSIDNASAMNSGLKPLLAYNDMYGFN
jgi:hypothetical protein